jgi:transposase
VSTRTATSMCSRSSSRQRVRSSVLHAVAADLRGYREAVSVVERYAGGARVWAIEGAGHYGAGFARFLTAAGETVIEVGRSGRSERRLRGRDDPLDALRAARSALAAETLTLPRAGQQQEALRVLLLARRSAVDVRRLALVQMRSVVVTAPDRLRAELRRLPTGQFASSLQRLPALKRTDPRRARDRAQLALAGEADRSRDRRGERTRARGRQSRPRACAATARRTGYRADRRRATDRGAGHTATASALKPLSPNSPALRRSPPQAARRSAISAAAVTDSSTAHDASIKRTPNTSSLSFHAHRPPRFRTMTSPTYAPIGFWR